MNVDISTFTIAKYRDRSHSKVKTCHLAWYNVRLQASAGKRRGQVSIHGFCKDEGVFTHKKNHLNSNRNLRSFEQQKYLAAVLFESGAPPAVVGRHEHEGVHPLRGCERACVSVNV